MVCKNCGTEYEDIFKECPACKTPSNVKRRDGILGLLPAKMYIFAALSVIVIASFVTCYATGALTFTKEDENINNGDSAYNTTEKDSNYEKGFDGLGKGNGDKITRPTTTTTTTTTATKDNPGSENDTSQNNSSGGSSKSTITKTEASATTTPATATTTPSSSTPPPPPTTKPTTTPPSTTPSTTPPSTTPPSTTPPSTTQ